MFNYREINQDSIEYYPIAEIDEMENGDQLYVSIGDADLVVFNIAGEIFAIGDICSHDDGPLGDGEIEGHEVICPRHGARFDVRSGEATGLPAVVDIPAYPVRVKDGRIEVGVPGTEA